MKLIRTLFEGDGEGVCVGVGGAGADGSGEILRKGNSPGVDEAIGVGESCADAVATTAT